MSYKSNISYFSKEFVEKLSIPRLVGTEGEEQAQKIIEAELKKLKIENYEKQAFFYSNFRNKLLRYYDVLSGLIMLAIFIRILLIPLIIPNYAFLFLILFILFITSFKSRTIKETESFIMNKKTQKFKSYNYITKIPSQEEKKKNKTVVLLAHYDSKSLTLHPILEGAIYFFGLVGGSIYSIHVSIVLVLFLLNLIPTISVIQFFYIFILIPLYFIEIFNKTGNKSPGANDNACGVASGLFLIDYLKENPLSNTNIIIVFTGAEEVGDLGAFNFMKEYSKELDEKNTFFLVIDSPGGNEKTNTCFWGQGLPKRSYSEYLYNNTKEVLKNNKELKMDFFYIPPLIPFMTDHTPLRYFGYYEFLIFSSNNRWHSEADNIDNYSPEMLENFFEFLKELVVQMDKK